ncbi:unnamed protein product, partial [Ectocarpus sp. 4 AP-2014]
RISRGNSWQRTSTFTSLFYWGLWGGSLASSWEISCTRSRDGGPGWRCL